MASVDFPCSFDLPIFNAMYFLANKNNANVLFHTLRGRITQLQPVFDIPSLELICSESKENTPMLFIDVTENPTQLASLIELQSNCYIVVIDSHHKHAQLCIQIASDVHIKDYLDRDCLQDQLALCLNKYAEWQEQRRISNKNNLIIKEKGAHIYIETNAIKMLEGFGSYTRIHTTDKVYIVSKTIKKILELLPNQFIRTHRSFAVHQKQARSLMGNLLLLQNGEFVKVSKSGRQVVLNHFNKAS